MGKFTKNEISVRTLASGDSYKLPTFTYKGTGAGPKTYIQSSLHGAELQGSAVIFLLMKYLKEVAPLGDITLVPLCNPTGVNTKLGEYTFGRFDSTTGDNWNRSFFYTTANKNDPFVLNLKNFVAENRYLSFEEIKHKFKTELKKTINNKLENALSGWGDTHGNRLALTLQSLAVDADIVLDLHTASDAAYYVYAPEYAKESAKLFGIPHVLLIPEQFAGAMDEANFTPWFDLKQAFSQVGRDIPIDFEAFTLELQGQEIFSLEKAREELQFIINYLKGKKVIPEDAPDIVSIPKAPTTFCRLKDFKNLYAKVGGLAHYRVKPGDRVKKGDVLAEVIFFDRIENEDDLESSIGHILAPDDAIVINKMASSAVHEGQSLFILMRNTWVE